jgi:5-methyltetrahydropteroyltriglutamate--homocysteine methyltransferase
VKPSFRADHVGSPQCGFASTEAGNPLTADGQWNKLEPVVRTANKIWS